MNIKYKYAFLHNDEVGYIYESDKFGMLIVFNGLVKISEPFIVYNEDGIMVNDNADFIEMFTQILPRMKEEINEK